MKATDPCPCGSGLAYDPCCGRLHAGDLAPTAEALLRSRYSAFVLYNEPYLLATWHPNQRPASVSFDRQQKWLGLKIVSARTTSADTAEVEFIARYRVGGASAARLHECSRFVREGDRWLYIDGEIE